LYSVVDDPDKELTEDIINASIDETIDKTQVFLNDRAIALEEAQQNYKEIRENRIKEIQIEINAYRKQIDEELGPEIKKLEEELSTLNAEKQTLEAQEEVDKEKVQEVQKRISEKERELSAAKGDPWIKRLESRIGEKEKEIEELNEDIEKKDEVIQKTTEELIKSVQKDIDNFNMMRAFLNRELKKAKLKRELDLLNAEKEKKREKGLTVYEERERAIYLRLLSTTYKHEDKILNARIDALKEDYDSRIYDLQTQLKKEMERLEDEFSFQERFLNEKISELERRTKVKSEEVDEAALGDLNALKVELSKKQESFDKAADELEEKEKKSLRDEDEQFEKNIAELKWEIKLTRLIYLQTDDPYRNTSVNAAIQNVGSKVKFEEEGFPLPSTFHVGVGYAILNTDTHAVKMGVQLNIPFHEEISVGVGAEYGFLDMFFFRTGYTFNSINRNISLGAGAKLAIGFTSYAVDYAFQPLPEYGYLHSIGISAYF
jgi:predicted  nucleic acid-binding Zn-ribbon protein